nr:hypothetical protein [Candidatus Sigynarchaeota archaeon]
MPNMRLVLIQGIVGGGALVILIIAILFQYIEAVQPIVRIMYIISVVMLVVLVLLSVIATFQTKTFIHPDDRLFGNTFTWILFMADTLALGHFFPPKDGLGVEIPFNLAVRTFSYEAGAYVLITFVLIYLVLIFSKKIGFHELIMGDPNKREKEIVARFILFSILLGAILVGLKYLLTVAYEVLTYTGGVWIIMGLSVVIILLIAITNWKKYAPVTDPIPEKK